MEKLGGSFALEGMTELVGLAFQCLNTSARRRPRMRLVAAELDRILEKEDPDPPSWATAPPSSRSAASSSRPHHLMRSSGQQRHQSKRSHAYGSGAGRGVAASVVAAQPPVDVLERRVASILPHSWRRISMGCPSGIEGQQKPRRARRGRQGWPPATGRGAADPNIHQKGP
ncbi:putative leucine-rich repeat receptor-like protein kinase [Panicum miliaceum]|uniref:Leucine-rich repeat receptor-like protein kinase n=1 Tax=Panicum miliaceum TaxID=4540 RepID=A0A3L6RHV9_PANMI|nr:putative leucine-rich repeat receptor-like protein kinase [Panicum miliaceum]